MSFVNESIQVVQFATLQTIPLLDYATNNMRRNKIFSCCVHFTPTGKNGWKESRKSTTRKPVHESCQPVYR